MEQVAILDAAGGDEDLDVARVAEDGEFVLRHVVVGAAGMRAVVPLAPRGGMRPVLPLVVGVGVVVVVGGRGHGGASRDDGLRPAGQRGRERVRVIGL